MCMWTHLEVANTPIERIISESAFLVQEFAGLAVHRWIEQAVIEALLQLLQSHPIYFIRTNRLQRAQSLHTHFCFFSRFYILQILESTFIGAIGGMQQLHSLFFSSQGKANIGLLQHADGTYFFLSYFSLLMNLAKTNNYTYRPQTSYVCYVKQHIQANTAHATTTTRTTTKTLADWRSDKQGVREPQNIFLTRRKFLVKPQKSPSARVRSQITRCKCAHSNFALLRAWVLVFFYYYWERPRPSTKLQNRLIVGRFFVAPAYTLQRSINSFNDCARERLVAARRKKIKCLEIDEVVSAKIALFFFPKLHVRSNMTGETLSNWTSVISDPSEACKISKLE